MVNPVLLDFPDHFETDRLLIRSPRPGDGAEIYAAVTESLARLQPWMPWATPPPTLEDEEALARRGQAGFIERKDLFLLLFLKGTETMVGASGLHRINWDVPRFEIGYWSRTRFEGQGYIVEAVSGISRFCFETLGARRVEIRMDDRNVRSWRVAERCGYTLEAILRQEDRAVDGSLRDTRIYAKIKLDDGAIQ